MTSPTQLSDTDAIVDETEISAQLAKNDGIIKVRVIK